MKTNAAVLFSQPGKWEVTEVDLDGPGPTEVLIKMAAAGLCHSDDQLLRPADVHVRGVGRPGGHRAGRAGDGPASSSGDTERNHT